MGSFLEWVNKQALEEGFVEYLDEMATVVIDQRGYLIAVNPDQKRKGDEYFKIYNSTSISKASKMIRVSFRKPKYVIHYKDSQDFWKFNSKEKKILIDILTSKSKMRKPDGGYYTNWEFAILAFNNEIGYDYEKTEENTVDNLKYPDALPIDLPMPDYKVL